MAPWIAQTICDEGARSATLARLLRAVGQSALIVHLVAVDAPGAAWDGRLQFVAAPKGVRYVRIELRPQAAPGHAGAVLAHELQHALEVHDGGVTSVAEVARLYDRIGFRVARGRSAGVRFDTATAIAAGVETLRELTGRPVDGPRPAKP